MAKILIVEDDEEIAMLERDYLEIEGFQALRPDPAGPDAAGAQRL